MSSTWARIIPAVGVVAALIFFTIVLTPLSNYGAQRFAVSPTIKSSGAIVVLGAGIWKKADMLHDPSLRRAIRGIELYKSNLAPVIVFSGSEQSDDTHLTEAELRLRLAVSMGVPEEAILKEEKANTTREESIRIAGTLAANNIQRILLVTESLHLRRATYLFERAGLEVNPAPSDNLPVAAGSPGERLWLAARIVQEVMALSYYRIAGYI